jgi:hypothetical protein
MSESAGRTRATALITVHRYEPSGYDEPAQGPVLTRTHVEESFSGDITGDGIVEFLQAARADGSASFVGIERVTGELGGRRGTFLLQDAGIVHIRLAGLLERDSKTAGISGTRRHGCGRRRRGRGG